MVPSADSKNKSSFSAEQMRRLANDIGVSGDSSSFDEVYREWTEFQLEDTPLPNSFNADEYWNNSAKQLFPHLTVLMRALLCMPYSNAASERVISMLKKVLTAAFRLVCRLHQLSSSH